MVAVDIREAEMIDPSSVEKLMRGPIIQSDAGTPSAPPSSPALATALQALSIQPAAARKKGTDKNDGRRSK
jgi:hypothetical protein